jgi:hypothetical protein
MQTRWAMNFLAGPLTRIQIPALNKLVGVVASLTKGSSSVSKVNSGPTSAGASAVPVSIQENGTSSSSEFTSTRPSVPKGIDEYFMPNNLTLSESAAVSKASLSSGSTEPRLVYRPAIIGQVQIRYLDRRYNLDQVVSKAVLVINPDKRGMIHWESFASSPFKPNDLTGRLDPRGVYASLDQPLSDVRAMGSIQKDFADWVFQTGEMRLLANLSLKVFASPDKSEAEFKDLCRIAAESFLKEDLSKLADANKKKLAVLQAKLDKEERELARDKSELSQRTMEEVGSGLETVLGLFGGRKRSVSTNLTKRRMTSSAKSNVDESVDTIADLKKQIAEFEKVYETEKEAIQEKWNNVADETTSIPVVPSRSNIFTEAFGVIWLPYYQILSGGQAQLLPGYKS